MTGSYAVAFQPKNAFTLALRENPDVARRIAGVDLFAMLLKGEADVRAWAHRLGALGVAHSPVTEESIGWVFSFHDPGGLLHPERFSRSFDGGCASSGCHGSGRTICATAGRR